ncbi:transposase [Neobacillus cucumis]|uniref:transposase n=1 Tax=Neobacillus cucumis TaxID=1740721 RepID=UPI00403EA19B
MYVLRKTRPELLFRLLFLQFLYSLSDERVIEDSKYNLAYKWFLGLNQKIPFQMLLSLADSVYIDLEPIELKSY